MNLINSISLITAFFGGMVALFAPCCITFLLPSYLANIFKNRRRVVLMTLIFGLGIATILVPTALGIRAVGQLFQKFHIQTYILGGIFMILLGLMELTNRKITLPMFNLTIDLRLRHDPTSVYILGIFSGITTSCCTPVLAGILTLSFLSATFFWAALAGLSYVAGMIVPLVVMAVFLERVNWEKLPLLRKKTLSFGGKNILLTDFLAGILFIVIGILFITLAVTGNIAMGTEKPLEQTLDTGILNLVRFLRTIPASEFIFAALLIGGFIFLIKKGRLH